MSADRLRQAAAVLRETAEAATPGPWVKSRRFGLNVVAPDSQIVGRGNRHSEVTDAAGESFNSANSAYIALTSPPFALAVAALLDGHAEACGLNRTPFLDARHAEAHAVADTVLAPTTTAVAGTPRSTTAG